VSDDPFVSVIMPVYNGELYLADAIESILNQTYENIELIIINDGSTDDSLSIIKKYAAEDKRIVNVSRENKGLIKTLNECVQMSKGEYIARMDSDDISLPYRLEMQIKLMVGSCLDVCGCHYSVINKYGKYIDTVYVPLDDNSLLLYLIQGVPFAHGAAVIRKGFLEDNELSYGLGGVKYAEDKALWIRIYSLQGKFGNVNEVLFKYREFNQSLSKINSQEIRKDNDKMKSDFFKRHSEEVASGVKALANDLEQLSNRELEYLADLTIRLFLGKKDIVYWRIFKKIPVRAKSIAFLKLLSGFIQSI